MNVNIDLTSFLAGGSLTAIGGWIASFFSFRKDERAVQLEQVTKERTKWRDNMRELCEEIATAYIENKSSPIPAKVVSLRARLTTSINPKDKTYDGAILAHYDRLFSDKSDDLEVFTHRIALLLKHDWERVKWECTPLYKKPFKRLSKNQREWRRENYREIESDFILDNHDSHMPEEKKESKIDRAFLQFIDVRLEDVTLKLIFDHIKNYGTAAVVIVAGFYLAQHGAQIYKFPGAGMVLGILLILSGLSLYALNVSQGIWVFSKLKISKIPYLFFSMLMFLITTELIWVFIRQHIHKS